MCAIYVCIYVRMDGGSDFGLGVYDVYGYECMMAMADKDDYGKSARR